MNSAIKAIKTAPAIPKHPDKGLNRKLQIKIVGIGTNAVLVGNRRAVVTKVYTNKVHLRGLQCIIFQSPANIYRRVSQPSPNWANLVGETRGALVVWKKIHEIQGF